MTSLCCCGCGNNASESTHTCSATGRKVFGTFCLAEGAAEGHGSSGLCSQCKKQRETSSSLTLATSQIATNLAVENGKKRKSNASHDARNLAKQVLKRIAEHPNCLRPGADKEVLWCICCAKAVSSHKSSCDDHLTTPKHLRKLASAGLQVAGESSVVSSVGKNLQDSHKKEASNLARPRVETESNIKGAESKKRSLAHDSKDVASQVLKRIAEHPNCLRQGADKEVLWCICCAKAVSSHKSSCNEHLKTPMHARRLASSGLPTKEESKLSSSQDGLDKRESVKHEEISGEKAWVETWIKTCLGGGIIISSMDLLRAGIEMSSKYTLPHADNLQKLVPRILQDELQLLKDEFEGSLVTVIFDGTTRFDEVFSVVLRYCTPQFDIRHKLIHLGKYVKCVDQQNLVDALVRVLSSLGIEMGVALFRGSIGVGPSQNIKAGQVIAFQRDGFAVDTTAISILLRMWKGSKDMECLSRLINHSCEHFATPTLKVFMEDLCDLLLQNSMASNHWYNILGKEFDHPGNKRWCAYYELLVTVNASFADVVKFIKTAVEGGVAVTGESGATMKRLTVLVDDSVSYANLALELALVVTVAKPLIQGAYTLEGEGPDALITHDFIERIKNCFQVSVSDLALPTLQSVTDSVKNTLISVHGGNSDTLNAHVKEMIEPVFKFYDGRVNRMLEKDFAIYRVARLSNPFSIAIHKPETLEILTLIDSLHHFSVQDQDAFATDLGEYRKLCEWYAGGIDRNAEDFDEMALAVKFWKRHGSLLPGLSLFAKYCFTLTSTSAAAVRAFSVLQEFYGEQQMRSSLEDQVFLSVLLKYNRA